MNGNTKRWTNGLSLRPSKTINGRWWRSATTVGSPPSSTGPCLLMLLAHCTIRYANLMAFRIDWSILILVLSKIFSATRTIASAGRSMSLTGALFRPAGLTVVPHPRTDSHLLPFYFYCPYLFFCYERLMMKKKNEAKRKKKCARSHF